MYIVPTLLILHTYWHLLDQGFGNWLDFDLFRIGYSLIWFGICICFNVPMDGICINNYDYLRSCLNFSECTQVRMWLGLWIFDSQPSRSRRRATYWFAQDRAGWITPAQDTSGTPAQDAGGEYIRGNLLVKTRKIQKGWDWFNIQFQPI